MKLVKLSVVAALAAGAFGTLEAKSLEEAIKNVDVSGYAHYRFDQASASKNANSDFQFLSIDSTNRPHRFKAFVTTAIDAGDGFKLVGQLMYNNDRNGGWASGTGDGSQGLTSTKNAIVLKQAYLQYDVADAGVSVLFGKQQLGTIWTDDLTGIAAKVLITPTEGLTIAAFGVDSFQGSGLNDIDNGDIDASPLDAIGYNAYDKNMYGAAVLGKFAGLDAQVWGAYWDKVATLYAVNLKYTLGLSDANNVGVKATYLGNAVASDLKNSAIGAGNGNLIDGRLFAKFGGLDARAGGIFYGNKSKPTINTLDDTVGPDLYIGREMFYVENTSLVLSQGRSTFGYVGVGYTLPADVRIGAQGVYGQNIQAAPAQFVVATGSDELKDTRWEAVGEMSWQASKNLSFLAYYSYLDSSTKNADEDGSNLEKTKQTVRFQAAYSF